MQDILRILGDCVPVIHLEYDMVEVADDAKRMFLRNPIETNHVQTMLDLRGIHSLDFAFQADNSKSLLET